MIEEVEITEIVLTDMQRLNKAFIHNMLEEWDNLDGKLPLFPNYVVFSVNQAWDDYVRWN